MKFLNNIRKEIKIGLILILAFSLIGFVSKKQDQRLCSEVQIYVNTSGSNFFLNKEDVYKLITADESDFVIGSSYDRVNLKAIEKRVRENYYVADAQAFTNLRGQMTVEVTLNEPIARFIIDGEKDLYLCKNGSMIPSSEKYTSRVLLVSGRFIDEIQFKSIQEDSLLNKLYELIRFIEQDEFWKAQIAQLDIDEKGDITIYPQVTKQYIEFGKPEDIDSKFQKLATFYKTILPYKGWNHYTRVNVEYKDQIVCE